MQLQFAMGDWTVYEEKGYIRRNFQVFDVAAKVYAFYIKQRVRSDVQFSWHPILVASNNWQQITR